MSSLLPMTTTMTMMMIRKPPMHSASSLVTPFIRPLRILEHCGMKAGARVFSSATVRCQLPVVSRPPQRRCNHHDDGTSSFGPVGRSSTTPQISFQTFATTSWKNTTKTTAAADDEPFYGAPRPSSTTTTTNWKHVPLQLMDTVASLLDPPIPSTSPPTTSSTSTNPETTVPPPPPVRNNDGTAVRVAALLRESATALRDPTRDDAVAAVGELTSRHALHHLHTVLQASSSGRDILHHRPLVSKATIPYQDLMQQATTITTGSDASNLTFGQAYGQFLRTHGFDPDHRSPLRYMTNDDACAYILLRYRQSHDFYHVLTGLPPTVVGELALKWLEWFQTHLPLTALAGAVGSVLTTAPYGLTTAERHWLYTVYLPWAYRIGHDQMPFGTLLTTYYEREWDTPLMELQHRMGLEFAPPLPPSSPSSSSSSSGTV